jgi:hypothetical protein
MAVQDSGMYQIWVLRLSLAVALLVVVLSWINALKIFDLIVRAGVSFGVMYLLMLGSLSLFERTAAQVPEEEQISTDAERGGLIDFSVGDDEFQAPAVQDSKLAGQVDPGLSGGIQDGQRQAEIVRRMGWE